MRLMKAIAFAVLTVGCGTHVTGASSGDSVSPTGSDLRVVPASEVRWEMLNPARGDKSPRAGTLWGDRNGTEATGFLVKFVDGFSSPPHIHNVTYRGVVISGLIHNDDPGAAHMWMPAGSYWTQPKGEAHITAAKGAENVAYIEIESGPYLVRPVDQAFDSGERPVNVDASNIVWLDAEERRLSRSSDTKSARVANLWTDGRQLNGTLVKLPAGFQGSIRSQAESLHAVVIRGQLQHRALDSGAGQELSAGSLFSSKAPASHHLSVGAEAECLLYIRARGDYEVVPSF